MRALGRSPRHPDFLGTANALTSKEIESTNVEGAYMKALVLTGRHEVSVMDFPGPPMGDNDVKVEVAYCGL